MPVSVRGDEQPWGHKVTVHIYVAGGIDRAADVSDCVCSQLVIPTAEFIGVSINEVQDAPIDQGGT